MLVSKKEFQELFLADLREKAKARPKQAIGKKKPRTIVTPSSFKEAVPWWKAAPSLVLVDIPSGQVRIFRWPLE